MSIGRCEAKTRLIKLLFQIWVLCTLLALRLPHLSQEVMDACFLVNLLLFSFFKMVEPNVLVFTFFNVSLVSLLWI